jgi:CRP-like cAMP-binding protein
VKQREATVREYAAGELLCRQGTGADRVFVLKSGTVYATVVPGRSLVEGDDPRLRQGHIVARHGESGLMLGMEGALTGQWLCSLIADGPVQAVDMPLGAKAITDCIVARPELGMELARMLGRRLVAAHKSLTRSQRVATRFQRDFLGLCVDFHNLVQGVADQGPTHDEILDALHAARRSWAFGIGEAGGADAARSSRVLMSEALGLTATADQRRELVPGEYLCRKGDAADSVILLMAGRLSVRVNGQIFGEVRPGEMAGEIGVLLEQDEPARTADIIAEEACTVGLIPKADFPRLLSGQPRLLANLCRLMCARVKAAEQIATEQDAQRSLAGRFDGGRGIFQQDVGEFKRRLEMVLGESNINIEPALHELDRLLQTWTLRLEELRVSLGTAPAQ